MTDEYQLIDNETDYRRAISVISRERSIGIDLESNGFFRYPECVCLLQISTPNEIFIVDPLALDDLSALGDALSNSGVHTILHSGSHDVISLDRDWGFRINAMFDTSIAAAFLGLDRLGLAAVLESVLDITIPKEKSLQRSDWTMRPLSRKALAYAANDVRHLLELRDVMERRLRKLGRASWVAEESERLSRIRREPHDPELAVFNVKGSRKLDARGLAILKALVDYREDQAVIMGKPHFRVIPDMALVALATEPDVGLHKVRGLGRFARGGTAKGIRNAIAEGRDANPLRRPIQPQPPRLARGERAAANKRLSRLKAWRIAQGTLLSLAPSLLWPMKSLQRIAREPDSLESELKCPEVRTWQREQFQESLRKALI